MESSTFSNAFTATQAWYVAPQAYGDANVTQGILLGISYQYPSNALQVTQRLVLVGGSLATGRYRY